MKGKHVTTAFRVDRTKHIVDGVVREWRAHETAGSFANALTIGRRLAEDDIHPVRIVEVRHTEVWRSE